MQITGDCLSVTRSGALKLDHSGERGELYGTVVSNVQVYAPLLLPNGLKQKGLTMQRAGKMQISRHHEYNITRLGVDRVKSWN